MTRPQELMVLLIQGNVILNLWVKGAGKIRQNDVSPSFKEVGRCSLSNYRAISLLRIIHKIFTHIIEQRVMTYEKIS